MFQSLFLTSIAPIVATDASIHTCTRIVACSDPLIISTLSKSHSEGNTLIQPMRTAALSLESPCRNGEGNGEAMDHDKPLPTHTSIDYYEAYARLVLLHIDPIKYRGLHLSDKPDLKDRESSIGVEVTQAISKNAREAENCYSKLSYERNEAKRLRLSKRIEQCGAFVESGIMFGPDGRDDFELILEAHRNKLRKLNVGNYELFKQNELFVLSNIFVDRSMCSNALKCILNQNASHTISFDMITISVPGENIRFDCKNASIEMLPFPSADQYDIACQARKTVIAGENASTA